MRRPIILALIGVFALAGFVMAGDVPVPEFMGLYYYHPGHDLVKLNRAPSTTAEKDNGKTVVGFPANTVFAQVRENVIFVAYHEKLELLEPNIIGLKWEGIQMVDGQEFKTDNWELNMYVRDANKIVRMNVAPLEGKQFAYKYAPEKPLTPGKYLFYFGRSLKDARVADIDKVFVFEVIK